MELLRLTDPKKVTFELDCGWATVAGMNPVDLMKNHPHRISMLHVKDFKLPGSPLPDPHAAKVTELGLGSIDYRPIFAEAARSQHIEHAFVEQEAFDMPWRESLQVDADYLRKFRA
jgi:sugar phosphate isomerase/epimerase